MKIKKKIIVISLGFILCSFIGMPAGAQSTITSLSQGDIINLSKPSIVKIYHQIDGQLTIPTIKLDIKTMSLSIASDNSDNSTAGDYTKPVASLDTVISNKFNYKIDPQTDYGTGFIVNPNGYIVTNAHVASDSYVEKDILQQLEKNMVDQMIIAYDDKYPGKLDSAYTDDQATAIYDQLNTDMLKLVTDNAKFNSQLVVIPQSSTDTTLEDILRDGLSAKVVSMEDDLFSDKNHDKDLAVIKIDQNNLPALKIDSTNSTQIGQKIFILGFPSSAELNAQDVINPTLTEGIVGAFKDSSDKSFKLIQTDAKISEGSSGSPIINEKGEVVGIATDSSSATDSVGDSFGWGLPSSFILKVMKDGSVSNDTSYYDNFSGGIILMNSKKCKSANEKFNAIKNTNDKFPINDYIQPYIDNCTKIISSGQSIDSTWDEIWATTKEFLSRTWALIIVFIAAVVGLVFVIIELKNQNKKEDDEINILKTSLQKDEADIDKIEVVVDSHDKEIKERKNQPTQSTQTSPPPQTPPPPQS
jgi:S1-C subfamily serine protease